MTTPISLGIYYSAKERWERVNPDAKCMPLPHLILLGGFAGVVGSYVTTPTDVMRVRMQASQQTTSAPLVRSFLQIYKCEGMHSIFYIIIAFSPELISRLELYNSFPRLLACLYE